MNTCKRLSESFSDYAENAMFPEQRRALEAHLSVCPGCHAEVARLQNLRGALSHLNKLQAPPDFEAILRARLRREGKRAVVPAQAPHRPFFVPRFALFGLAVTLVFLSVSFWWRHNSGGNAIAPVSFSAQSPLYRIASPVIPLTAHILYTLDKFTPNAWPLSKSRKGEEHSSLSDSLSVNPEELPHGPQNSRASLFSL